MKNDHVDIDAWESIKDFFKFMLVVGLIWAILFLFLGCAHVPSAPDACPIAGPESQGKCND
jgi:hypothetical protein